MRKLPILLSAILYLNHICAATSLPGSSSYVVPANFPTSVFPSYYYMPAQPTQEPQPAIYDPVLQITFPYNLTNPETIPTQDEDPVLYPVPKANLSITQQEALIQQVMANVSAVLNSTLPPDPCSKCKAALSAAQPAAWYAPTLVPDAMVSACKAYKFQSNATCEGTYNATNYGAVLTQVLYFADVQGLDGQHICNMLSSKFCSAPTALPLNTTSLFPKPKPVNAVAPKASGKRVKVLHLTDIHLDPRYYVGAEATCSGYMCCRVNTFNTSSPNKVLFPAPVFGAYQCDAPYFLALAALQAVGPLTGTEKGNGKNSLAWTIYTGDVVPHDPLSQISRAYAEYSETSVYEMIKSYISGPVFPTLGNHDTNPEAIDAPYKLPGPLGQQTSWNYEHVAGLWLHEGWIKPKDVAQVSTHYGGYSIKSHHGLRIISFNTDFWYRSNVLNYINTTDPDNSGVFSWMISELQKAEDACERVWIVAHVLSGWDGSQGMTNPTNLFYQIVDRYSPHVIANVFFGHTHEDQFFVYYANNGTVRSADTALSTGWVMPSVTPLTNLNSGFRLYEVDTGDFNIYEAYTYYSDVNTFSTLNGTGPTFKFEYSTRDSFGPGAGWSAQDPLNATFWHRVTEAMEKDVTLVSLHNTYQGKMSIKTPNCTSTACQTAKICYMRSASTALSSECPTGYSSVQGPFSGP